MPLWAFIARSPKVIELPAVIMKRIFAVCLPGQSLSDVEAMFIRTGTGLAMRITSFPVFWLLAFGF